jgi:Uma2 family endonuclease
MSLLESPPLAAFTPDDVLKMDGPYELVDGRLVEKQMSALAGKTATRFVKVLANYVDDHDLGDLYVESSFIGFSADRDRIRRPDIAFVAAARRHLIPDEGHIPVPPDLAIEVISPDDTVYELDDKLIDYRNAGIPLVWVLNPQARHVRVFRAGKPMEEFFDTDRLTGDPVLPGFAVAVTELLPPRK